MRARGYEAAAENALAAVEQLTGMQEEMTKVMLCRVEPLWVSLSQGVRTLPELSGSSQASRAVLLALSGRLRRSQHARPLSISSPNTRARLGPGSARGSTLQVRSQGGGVGFGDGRWWLERVRAQEVEDGAAGRWRELPLLAARGEEPHRRAPALHGGKTVRQPGEQSSTIWNRYRTGMHYLVPVPGHGPGMPRCCFAGSGGCALLLDVGVCALRLDVGGHR